MIKPYEKYKKSKLEWINEVPFHWQEGKVSYYFEIGRGRVISELELNPDGKYPVYSSQTKNDGCLGYIDTFDYNTKMLTWTTDGVNAGSVFMRSGKFNCTNVCGTLIPKKELDLKFYLYYLQHITQFYKRPDTNGAKIMNNEMARIYFLVPPLSEQIQIANYLDYQTGIIDELIAKKERLVELLQEKRQSVINNAVTKGLNPNAKMKDSGIEWLGEVPEGWKKITLRYLTEKIGSGLTPRGGAEVYVDEGVVFIRSQNVHFKGLILDDVVKIEPEVHESMGNSKVEYNDVLLNITGASIGRCCVVDIKEEMNVNQHVCIIRPKNEIDPYFLNYILQSFVGQTQIELGITGGNREGLTISAIKDFVVFFPEKSIQLEILKGIESAIKGINELEFKIIKQIDNLKSYRQSIISEAVTGKVDLQDWKAPDSN